MNDVCSKNNGNCSHFCLPNGVGGRTCGCEGWFDLLSDGLTCENGTYFLSMICTSFLICVLPSDDAHNIY